MEPIGKAVARVAAADGSEPPAPLGRVVDPRMRGGEVVLPAQSPAMPRLSRALRGWVDRASEVRPAPRDPDAEPREVDGGIIAVPARMPPTPATAAEKAEAREPAERMRRILSALAHPATIEAWLQRATATASNPPKGKDRQRWVAAMVLALHGRPEVCFSAETANTAILRFTFWPSGGEVAAFCDEVEGRYRAVLRGLEDVERAPRATGPGRERPPEPVEAKSPEAIEAVRAKAAAFDAEMRALAVARRGDRPSAAQPRHLTPAQTIAQLEHEIAVAGGPGRRPTLDSRLAIERQKTGGGRITP